MERRDMETTAANLFFLRGLMSVPLGALCIVATLGNWHWGPLRHDWVFVLALVIAGLISLGINRYYNEHYGRVTPSTKLQTRTVIAGLLGVVVMTGGSLLLRSNVAWSLNWPVNPVAASFAIFFLIYCTLAIGLRVHHVVIWGAVLVAGLAPLWGDLSLGDASNIGLVIAGVAAMVAGVFDHLALSRIFGPSRGLDIGNTLA
jgi:hypothetical protein